MRTIKILSILTLIFNALILISAGHGFGPLILIEILLFFPDFMNDSRINIIGNYDERLIPFALTSIIFQIILIFTLFINSVWKRKLINLSCVFLIISLFYFTYDIKDSNLSRFTIISGIPFLITSILLIIKNITFRTDLKK